MESWLPQSAWLSSGAAMFVFLNVLVGAVAVMSRGQQGGHGRRLCRSASSMVLGRLRSFSFVFPECHYRRTPEEGEMKLQVGEAAPELVVPEPRNETDEAEEKGTTRLDDEQSVQGQQHHAPASAITAKVEGAGTKEQSQPAAKEAAPESGSKRREAEEAVAEGKAELNARAELFIRNFREDLKLQRLNSIINYTRALRRRAGAALLPQE